jgi:hypothetical protein
VVSSSRRAKFNKCPIEWRKGKKKLYNDLSRLKFQKHHMWVYL